MTAQVYYAKLADNETPEKQAGALSRAFDATGFVRRLGKRDMVAIKFHVGEKNNVTYVPPALISKLVELVKAAQGEPFLTDTSTLYRGRRENAIRHALIAHEHGFGIDKVGAPFIPLDGLSGNHETEVEIAGELNKTVKIAGDLLLSDALIALAHPTGHIVTGFGAALKNIGMGLSSRAGKMRQHSGVTPEVMPDLCQDCSKCIKWCPRNAIEARDKVSYIRSELCIGCGQCIAVCRFGAIKFDFGIDSPALQKNMAEHAAGALKHFGDKAVFINALINVTSECDCMNKKQTKAIPDLGVLASLDIVALDQATLDLTKKAHGKNISELFCPAVDGHIQIKHAEKIGLGSTKYQLVEV